MRSCGIKGACCFVAEQNLGIGSKRACYGNTLLLTAGQLCRICISLIREPDNRKQLGSAPTFVGALYTCKLKRKAYIGKTGALHQQIKALKYHCDLAA